MAFSKPYQPLLLRILHGLTGFFLIAATLTALWTYDTYDGRWINLHLPAYLDIEGVHGTFGLYTLLIFPAFVVYAFHRGRERLVQPNALTSLTQVGKPVWWYTLNRLTNTFALVALTFALFSGKMMDETWLPKGELDHAWYYAHLAGWVVMVVAIALHVLLNAKVGGVPWLLSMFSRQFRKVDSPRFWHIHIRWWWRSQKFRSWQASFQASPGLIAVEIAILICLCTAWFVSTVKQFFG
ncbi:MAG: cytochrome b/b6 domain-containing protein [Cyanobacteria bacterium P01_D01_bin.1]